MFLRKIGRQFLLLHSYREGSTRVRHMTVQRFLGVEGLQACLNQWDELQQTVEARFSNVQVNWADLRTKFVTMAERESRTQAPRSSAGSSPSNREAGRTRGYQLGVEPGADSEADGAEGIEEVGARVAVLRRALGRVRRLMSRESNPEVLRLAGNDLNELMTSLGEVAPSESAGVERELTLAIEMEEQSWKSARSHLRRAQRLRPWDGGLWRLEGDLLSRHSRWKGAEKAFRQACMLDFHRLPVGRRVFHPGDPDAQGYLHALDGLARTLAEQGRWEDACIWLTERTRRCSDTHAREALGAALHRAGRFSEAREQFRKLPDRDWRRHYNEAASWLEQGAVMSALPPLLRALARNDWPACTLPPRFKSGPRMNPPDLDYWECFGSLWSEESRAFLRAIRADRALRFLLSYHGKKRLRVRVVAPPEAMRGYARRALAELLQDPAAAKETTGSRSPCC